MRLLRCAHRDRGQSPGLDVSYFKARYGKYCEEASAAKLPGWYIMCRALGVGRLREVEKN